MSATGGAVAPDIAAAVAALRAGGDAALAARHAAAQPGPLEAALEPFTDALCDDLNVARAIAARPRRAGRRAA